jgi:predicted Zn finger-like uncharacterized protein
MLIVCPSCATSYDVEAATLQPDGRRVRCVRCQNVWLAEPAHADKLLAAAKALGPFPAMAATAEVGVEEATAAPAEASWQESTIRQAEDGDSHVLPAESPSEPEPEAVTEEAGAAAEIDAPPIVPADLDEGQPPIEVEAEDPTEPAEDIETYAARREKRYARNRFLRWPLSPLQSGVLALLIVDALLVGWRDEFVRVMPQTASFYSMLGLNVNLRGMAFDGVGTTTEQNGGVPVLMVEGNIVNDSRKMEDVPRLKFAVRNASGQEVYSWTVAPPRPTLSPGEAIAFHSRLASPPVEAHDILVRFVTRRDIIAGAH